MRGAGERSLFISHIFLSLCCSANASLYPSAPGRSRVAQSIVQRALSAKSVVHARAACVLAGELKSSGFWMLVLPGMIARILYTDEVLYSAPSPLNRYSRVGTTSSQRPYDRFLQSQVIDRCPVLPRALRRKRAEGKDVVQ